MICPGYLFVVDKMLKFTWLTIKNMYVNFQIDFYDYNHEFSNNFSDKDYHHVMDN